MIKSPITAQLEITEKCNYKCPHCYQPKSKNYTESSICTFREDKEKRMLLVARKIVEAGIFNVVLTGGEPLMFKKCVINLMSFFKSHDLNVFLNTNLALMDEKFLNEILSLDCNGMLISCPSTKSSLYKKMTGNGDLEKFMERVNWLVEKRAHFTVNMVVNKNNLNNIRETAEKMKEIGVKRFAATPMALNVLRPQLKSFLAIKDVQKVIDDLIWVKEKLKLHVDIMEAIPKCTFPQKAYELNLSFLKRKCQAGITTVAISPKGEIRPCTHNPGSYGNIMEEGLEKAWGEMSEWRNNSYTPTVCKKCKVLKSCSGGCRTTAKAYGKTWKSKDPWMTNPIEKSQTTPMDIKINKNSIISINPFRHRREKDKHLIVSSKNNILLINEEFFKLIQYLKTIKQIKLSDLSMENNISFSNQDFQRVMKILLKSGFVSILKKQQGGKKC